MALIVKRRVFFLLLVSIGLALLSYCLFNSNDYHLFIKPDVGGHGHGYIYYDNGIWTRRVHVGYENEILLTYADLSPDGSKIAFKLRSFLNIYDLVSNQLTQVNSEPLYPSESTSIQWSPDGSQIGFPCNLEFKEPIELCAWDVAKGELRVLSNLHPFYGNFDYLSFGGWSADGKTLAFIIAYPEENPGNKLRRILLLDLDTGDVVEILDSQRAGLEIINLDIALSPNGKTILFSGNTLLEEQEKDFTPSLYQVNSDGSGLHRLIDFNNWQLFRPVWSPDGRSFYVNASDYYTLVSLQYDLSGRLVSIFPFQLGRWMLSWRSESSEK